MPRLIALVALLAGCSGGSTRTVSGQLDLTQLRPVNGQVVAISSTGQRYRAPIAANGSFSLALPTGASYSLRFANATSTSTLYDTFAVLSSRSTGKRWFTLGAGAAISLGNISRTATAGGTSGLGTMSESGDTGEANQKDDGQEDDSAEACDVSGGTDEAEVASDHDLASDANGELDDAAGQELDDQAEQPCKSGSMTGATAVPGVV